MKKVLLPLVIVSAVLFTACNSKKETTDREMVLLTDSMYKSNLGSDTAAITQQEAPQVAEPEVAAPVVRTKKPAPRRTNQTYNQPVQSNNQPPAPVAVANPTTTAPAPTTGTGTETAGTETTTPEKKKEGISKAAQGAIIGGVGGAVAGAVIGKGGKGAVIGGVIGAAGGYILGRKKDRASGRVPTKTDTTKTGN